MKPAQPRISSAPLIGLGFLTFLENDMMEWQGQVVAQVEPGWYLIQLFSWVDGGPTDQRVVTLGQMADWRFYRTLEQLREEGDRRFSEQCQQRVREAGNA